MSKQDDDNIDAPPLDRDDQAAILAQKSREFGQRFESTRSPADLNEAIGQVKKAIELAESIGYKAAFQNNLGRLLRLKFELAFQDDDIEMAIDAGRQCLAMMSSQSPGKPLFLSNLSDSLEARFLRKGHHPDLQESLQLARDAVEASSYLGSFRAEALETLAFRLSTLYKSTLDVGSLSEAIRIGETLVAEVGEDDSSIARNHSNLALHLELRYKTLNKIDDLEACIRHAQDALDKTSTNQTSRLQYAVNLNEYLRTRAEQTGSLADLSQVVLANSTLLKDMPSNHPQRFNLLISFARALRDRHVKTGSLEDLGQAIFKAGDAAAIANTSNRNRAIALRLQSELLEKRGEREDMTLALRLSREALKLPTEGSLDHIFNLISLSNRLSSYFSSSGRLLDIEEAITLAREVVHLAPQTHVDRPAWIHNLGLLLRKKAEVTDTENCLNQAIELERKAIDLVNEHSIDLPMFLDGLSTSLSIRYRTTGASADLEEAVRAARAAVAATNSGNVSRLIYLNSLSNRLCSRYDRWKTPGDLDDAITAISEAIAVAPNDDVYLTTLSNALTSRYEAFKNEEDLEEAIVHVRKATELLLKTDARYVRSLNNLGLRIMTKYEISSRKDHVLLEQAVQIAQECVDLSPTGHRDLPSYLNQLGIRLIYRAEKVALTTTVEEGLKIFDQAILVFQRSFGIDETLPQTRIMAGRFAGFLLMGNEKWAEAYDILQKTVNLFQRVSPRSLPRGDQQRMLNGFSGISALACSAAMNDGMHAAQALEVLEAGRGIIASLVMNVRTDVSALASVNPDLSSTYEQARATISTEPSIGADSLEAGVRDLAFDFAKSQQQTIARLEQIESDIRSLPGFERFQLPPTSEQLMHLAKSGPLVCFNVTSHRSDALLVTVNGIESVHLADLTVSELKENVQRIIGPSRLSRASVLEKSKSNKEMQRILRWLWSVAVHPVLQKLRLLKPDDGSVLTRLWWVTSGYMGLMPLHAAGDYEMERSKNCTASYVVSSYIPTFKALVYARDREARAHNMIQKDLLIVSMPTTPGSDWKPLNVVGEVAAIERSYKAAQGTSNQLQRPSAHDVLERLKSHSIVHFACHGDPDVNDPSDSSLILCKDAQTVDRLTVKQLSQMTHANAQLAYLSACCTAQQYSLTLMDEVIHLGSAFQLIGYPSVVGTLWEADDMAAANVAEAFYEQFAVAKPHDKTSDVAARALHQATLKIRDQRRARVRRPDHDVIGWAPFIHIGA